MKKNESLNIPVPRILSLDGLRGIAILAVVSFHYVNNQLVHATSSVAKFLGFVTSFGWVGVDLFFVLSGYLIGNIIVNQKESENFFSTFYIRRFLRIVPHYYLLLGVFIVIQLIPSFETNYFLTGNMAIPGWSYALLAQNIFMADSANLGNSALSVTWSICIEEQFYLVFPVLAYFVHDRALSKILLALIVSASLIRFQFTNWIPAYVLLPSRMDAI